MSGGPVSAFDVVGMRGRGYRPEQVDRTVAALLGELDGALDQLSRLRTLTEERSAESARLREVVASLAPQTYASLGERAQRILALAEAEAEAVRAAAAEEAQALLDGAETAGREAKEAALAEAESVRAAAEEAAGTLLEAARDAAGTVVREALEEAGRIRGEADADMAETRRRTAGVLAHQEREHTERGKAAEEETAVAVARVAAREAELAERGEALLARARRELSEAEEAARHRQEDTEAQAAGMLAEARVAEERVGRETDRVLREHEEAREEVRSHMAHVRTALAALTGRTLSDREPAGG